jgi:hypothetical protein
VDNILESILVNLKIDNQSIYRNETLQTIKNLKRKLIARINICMQQPHAFILKTLAFNLFYIIHHSLRTLGFEHSIYSFCILL